MNDISRATQLLRDGHLVAFPTETVYGLGADATNPRAIDLIYQTKGRPSTNPLIVHVASAEVARRYVADWPEAAQRLAEIFWPGPLTIVLPKRDLIPANATAGLPTVGLRVPKHSLALDLLRTFDGPLAAPSANRSTRVSPTTAQHVRDEFPHTGEPGREPAMILEGGPCEVGIESTVLDLTTPTPTLLRPGRVKAEDLEPIIGPVVTRDHVLSPAIPAASPGQSDVHYAPVTPTYRFETSQRGLIHPETDDGVANGMVVLSPLVVFKKWGPIIAMPNLPDLYARHFYNVLRELDAQNLHAIYIEVPPDEPKWSALRDRIRRASKPLPTE